MNIIELNTTKPEIPEKINLKIPFMPCNQFAVSQVVIERPAVATIGSHDVLNKII